MAALLHFKVSLRSDLRRFALPSNASFSDVLNALKHVYRNPLDGLHLTYTDEESDLITIRSDIELQEFVRISSNSNKFYLRLSLEEYPPVCQSLAIPLLPDVEHPVSLSPRCVPSRPIVPNLQLPQFDVSNGDAECPQSSSPLPPSPSSESDLSARDSPLATPLTEQQPQLPPFAAVQQAPDPEEYDLTEKMRVLEERALTLHQDGQHEEALACAKQHHQLHFQLHSTANNVCLYNIACMHAALNQNDDALAYLRQAVDAGFQDIGFMMQDIDLASIRDTDAFKRMIAELSQPVSEPLAELRSPEPPIGTTEEENFDFWKFMTPRPETRVETRLEADIKAIGDAMGLDIPDNLLQPTLEIYSMGFQDLPRIVKYLKQEDRCIERAINRMLSAE